jgi:hypothetical protein
MSRDRAAVLIKEVLGWSYSRALEFKRKHHDKIEAEAVRTKRPYRDVAVDLAEQETDMIDEEALEQMRERLKPNTKWAAYQNVALDSGHAGHIQFLHVGEGRTFTDETLPEAFPFDNEWGMGWRYRFIGWANLDTRGIERVPFPRQ